MPPRRRRTEELCHDAVEADQLLCALTGGAEVPRRVRCAHLRPPLRLRSVKIPSLAVLSSSFLADS